MQTKENLLKEYLENQIISIEEIEVILNKVLEFIEDIPPFEKDPLEYWDTCQNSKFNAILLYFIIEKLRNINTDFNKILKEV